MIVFQLRCVARGGADGIRTRDLLVANEAPCRWATAPKKTDRAPHAGKRGAGRE